MFMDCKNEHLEQKVNFLILINGFITILIKILADFFFNVCIGVLVVEEERCQHTDFKIYIGAQKSNGKVKEEQNWRQV